MWYVFSTASGEPAASSAEVVEICFFKYFIVINLAQSVRFEIGATTVGLLAEGLRTKGVTAARQRLASKLFLLMYLANLLKTKAFKSA